MVDVATVPPNARVRASVYLGMQEIILTLLHSASKRAIAIEPRLQATFDADIETAIRLFRSTPQPTPEQIETVRCGLHTGIASHEVAEYILTGKQMQIVRKGQRELIDSIAWALANEAKSRATQDEKDELRDPSVLTARVMLYACLSSFPAPEADNVEDMLIFKDNINRIGRLLQHAYPEDWLRAMLKMTGLSIQTMPLADDEYEAMMAGHNAFVAGMQDELAEIEKASAEATAAFMKEQSNGNQS